MRTTLNIDDRLLAEAQRLCGVTEKAALVREGLKALIERESAQRLARLGRQRTAVGADPASTPEQAVILVDTSVWWNHLRSGEEALAALLNGNRVLMYPFMLGELACGNLRQRAEVLALLKSLPQVTRGP